jgi:hypothetical protein
MVGGAILGLSLSGLFFGCAEGFHKKNLAGELSEMRSEAAQASAEDLVKSGERAIVIADEASVAEDLATDGVAQLSISAFNEALVFFEMALKKDQGNEKALFYYSLLRPLRALEGLYYRLSAREGGIDPGFYDEEAMAMFFGDVPPEFALGRYLWSNRNPTLKSQREVTDSILKPLREELQESRLGFQKLLTNPEFDLTATLPKDFAKFNGIRFRSADLRAIKALYLNMSLWAKFVMAYQFPDMAMSTTATTGLTDAEILALYLKDPGFGLLLEPTIFNEIRSGGFELIEDVQIFQSQISQRYQRHQNSRSDLLRAEKRRMLRTPNMGRITVGVNSPQNSGVLQAQQPVETLLQITIFGTWQRRFFDETYDQQPLTSVFDELAMEELQKPQEGMSLLDPNPLASLSVYLKGPVEATVSCVSEKGEPVEEKVWIDFPSFATHPVKDLKALAPRYVGGTKMSDIYFLKDPTLGGLFRPHHPCYEWNQKRHQHLKKSLSGKPAKAPHKG